MSLIRCHECNAEISDLALSCPKCGTPPKSVIKQSKHNEKISNLNNELSLISVKNRNAKIVSLVLIVGVGIATIPDNITECGWCFGLFFVMLISDPYHYSMKKIKRRIKIEDRFNQP